jgi:hypothetical protein
VEVAKYERRIMVILFEFIVGFSIGIEYFDEEEAWIVSLGIARLIFLKD